MSKTPMRRVSGSGRGIMIDAPSCALDLERLENVKEIAGWLRARCPACAADGHDRKGQHLRIGADGRFGCVLCPGDTQHRRRCVQLAGKDASSRQSIAPIRPPVFRPPAPVPAPRMLRLPVLRRLSCTELARICVLRKWPSSLRPLDELAERGMLFGAQVWDDGSSVDAWILTDGARKAAQARRLDGKPFTVGNGHAKAKTLAGSTAAWPVGIASVDEALPIFLCEGMPDCLAVALMGWLAGVRVQPIAMLGAGQAIHNDALPLFEGRRVRIVEQNDDPSREAAASWGRTLRAAGAQVDGWCPPEGVKDAADLQASFTVRIQGDDELAEFEAMARGSELFLKMEDSRCL
jgi:hypothetical protein